MFKCVSLTQTQVTPGSNAVSFHHRLFLDVGLVCHSLYSSMCHTKALTVFCQILSGETLEDLQSCLHTGRPDQLAHMLD